MIKSISTYAPEINLIGLCCDICGAYLLFRFGLQAAGVIVGFSQKGLAEREAYVKRCETVGIRLFTAGFILRALPPIAQPTAK